MFTWEIKEGHLMLGTLRVDVPAGHKITRWADLKTGDKVFILGTHDMKPRLYGPHRVADTERRTLENSKGHKFLNLLDDLVTRTEEILWNPRYVRFAEVHGKSPEAQLDFDQVRWPGGCMCGFILWMADAYRLYYDTFGRSSDKTRAKGPLDLPCDRTSFPTIDAFLATYTVQVR
jgi:hypothetical protein